MEENNGRYQGKRLLNNDKPEKKRPGRRAEQPAADPAPEQADVS